jgi:glutamate/tyrosine decarboxylase-like PLP-dependent enzyme
VAEEVAAGCILDLLGLPPGASVGFVTGGSMANATCLAAARGEVLRRAGWDVEAEGLASAPALRVIVGEEAHVTVLAALRLLGVGAARVVRVPVDGQGRMRAEGLRRALGGAPAPTIVCAQAGNVNTGAFDPIAEIADACGSEAAWLHVDGAFGLWAAASTTRPLVRGLERADSWAVDAHKWLNVPYDSGLAITAHPNAHRAVTGMTAAYLVNGGADRSGYDWTPEASRRARGFAVWAALRSLGRDGVAALVDGACALARRAAGRLAVEAGVEVLNDVVLNQALVRFHGQAGPDATTRAVVDEVQRDGVCWLGGTVWRDMTAMRLSVSCWRTTEADVDLAVDAILRARRGAAAPAAG